jgi:hypothetical protein
VSIKDFKELFTAGQKFWVGVGGVKAIPRIAVQQKKPGRKYCPTRFLMHQN